MEYYHSKKLQNISFDQAISKVTEALKEEGFGILTEIDVQAILKKKLSEIEEKSLSERIHVNGFFDNMGSRVDGGRSCRIIGFLSVGIGFWYEPGPQSPHQTGRHDLCPTFFGRKNAVEH